MASEMIMCSQCQQIQPRGARYCLRCGEPMDPALVAELQSLYSTMTDLDQRIANGQGQQTIMSLRDDYHTRYLSLRFPQPPVSPAPTVAALATPNASPSALPAPTTSPLPQLAAQSAQSAPQTMRQPRPVFTWRAFVAEQAIAIMAYLGGFLLLVATLTFEVGGWQVLPNPVKFAAVCVVYLLFGALGFALRRAQRLQTVGRAYLGVFALMTPLVALAAYRFVLQGAGFPAAGMLCLAAFYAAIIYLTLAWRTGFFTYSYLGWAAVILGALAIIPWAQAPVEWMLFDLTLVGLALQAPRRVRLLTSAQIARPATQLSVLVAAGAGLWLTVLGVVSLLGAVVGHTQTFMPSLAAYALASCAYPLLTFTVSQSLRSNATRRFARVAGFVDFLTTAFAALAVIALVGWLEQVTHLQMALAFTLMGYMLALLALAEMGAAQAIRRLRPLRRILRLGMELLALVFAAVAPLLTLVATDHTGSLIATLTIGLLVMCVGAALENALGWGLLAGLFLTLDFHTIFGAVLPAGLTAASGQSDNFPGVLLANSSLQMLLALAFWAAALILGEVIPRPAAPSSGVAPTPSISPSGASAALGQTTPQPTTTPYTRPRVYLAPLYLTALGNAFVAMSQFEHHTNLYQVVVLALFALAGLIAGWRLGQPVVSGLVYGSFGMIAITIAIFSAPGIISASVAMVGFAVVPLVIRRLLGRAHALGPYIIALWATLAGAVFFPTAGFPNDSVYQFSLVGISIPAWTLLLMAALLAVYALLERAPALMVFPALACVSVASFMTLNLSLVVFTLVAVGVGLALRSWRGAWWGAAWYAVAVPVSLIAFVRVAFSSGQVISGPDWGVVILLVFLALTYVVAARERLPWLTMTALPYALGAYIFAPPDAPFTVTLGITLATAALAVIVRARFGRRWALALYAVGVLGTLFSVPRVTPYDGAHLEATLLLFAALAYVIAYFERAPLAGFAPLLYVVWAVFLQADPHNLLPLAIGLAVVGVLLGRFAGPRWSWPAYAAATVAAVATALQAQPQPGFEAISLVALTILAYGIAALESRPDVTPLAFLLGALALAAAANAVHMLAWEVILAYAGLGWTYALLGQVWRALPWLRARGAWWLNPVQNAEARARWADPHFVGEGIHRWASVILSAAALGAGWLTGNVFDIHAASTQAEAIALLALASLLLYHARTSGIQALYYIAGEFLALAITWEARWLGAENLQWFILAPGSYHVLIGALLPADERLGRPVWLGQSASAVGALILLAPTFGQSFQAEPGWLYALILAIEALVIAGIGVGLSSRLLVVVGSAFVGLAALRGAVLAVSSGLPVPAVIALVAILLMGAATWLSLRARGNVGQSPHP